GMGGAARMAGEAALRVGAGLVSLAVHPRNIHLNAERPELMVHGAEHPDDLRPLLERATVMALGPGLGRAAWSEGLWHRALEADLPMVVDADGLNLLARYPLKREDWILTPHPGEAARLLGVSVDEVQGDRFAAVGAIQDRYGGTCILKGAGTLIASSQLSLCPFGNPGMASGGMGDVLTGVIAGLWAQGLEGPAEQGVCLHALAGDRAAEAGERGLLALDLMPFLRSLANAHRTAF
ncbi:MAG: NAD(P)H-hydrate dehydratase, partial [Gammaproteobacteria bacterium]